MPISGGGSSGGGGGNVTVTAPVDGSGYVQVDLMTAVPAGANAIGTVGVTALPALPAGGNAIGTVGVTALPAIPAGGNTIGAVTQASGPWTINVTQIASTALGAPTAAGSSASGNILAVQGVTNGVPQPQTTPNAFVRLSSSFTRPANTTAYAAGRLVANSTTAGSVTPLSFASASRVAGDCFRIERVRLMTSSTSLTTASFIVHFFESSPTVSVGDGAAFDSSGTLSTTGALVYAGNVPITLTTAGSDGAVGIGVPGVGNGITMAPQSGTTVYALIEANSAYTPTSGETITVIIEGYRS